MLKGQALADKYVELYTQFVSIVSGFPANKCNIWATYKGGGWIELRGENVPARREMQAECPNGWSLCDVKRSGDVRATLTILQQEVTHA